MIARSFGGGLVCGLLAAALPGWPGAGRAGPGDDKAEDARAAFAPEAGRHYQVFMPDGRPYFGDRKLVLVRRVYANGWAEARTEEGQTCWLNFSQAMQLYRIDDVEAWRRLAFPGERK